MQSFGWTVDNVGTNHGCGGGYYYFWMGGYGTGSISIPLPTGFSDVTIEYGQSCSEVNAPSHDVNVQLNGVVVSSIDRTCAASRCYVYPPVESCLKTFSMKYSPGDVLSIQESGVSIAYIKTIKVGAPLVILEGSTAGYRCTALTMINTAAECQAAASALGLTWVEVSAGAHYQDGCSVFVGYNLVAPLTNVWFNPRTRVNGGQCVHTNGDTSDGSCNHKSICH